MVKKCLSSIGIQRDLWQPSSSGRNEEALGDPRGAICPLGGDRGFSTSVV